MPRIAKVVDVPAIGELDRLAGQLTTSWRRPCARPSIGAI